MWTICTEISCIPHLSFDNLVDCCCELGVPCDCSQRLQPDSPRRRHTAHVSQYVSRLLSELEFIVFALALHIYMFLSAVSALEHNLLQRHRSWVLFLPDSLFEHGLR